MRVISTSNCNLSPSTLVYSNAYHRSGTVKGKRHFRGESRESTSTITQPQNRIAHRFARRRYDNSVDFYTSGVLCNPN